MTRWVALALRVLALYLAWKACQEIYGVCSVFYLFHGGTQGMPGWSKDMMQTMVDQINQNLETTTIYRNAAIYIIMLGVAAAGLWFNAMKLACVITHGLAPEMDR